MHIHMKHGSIVSRATGTVAKPPLVALPAVNGYCARYAPKPDFSTSFLELTD